MDFRLHWRLLRRLLLLAALAALTVVPAASGAFRPIDRDFGERSVPLVRHGTVTIPKGHGSEPRARHRLAEAAAARAGVRPRPLRGRLGAPAERPLRRVEGVPAADQEEQAVAIAQLHKAMPAARVSWRYQVVLNGFAVSIPARQLAKLSRQSFAGRVWPSFTYQLAMNRSPAVIGADVFHDATGANGEGVKIGVVDDGIDNTNPFLSGAGFTRALGLPDGPDAVHERQDHRRARVPGPRVGQAGEARARPQGFLPRHARRRHRRR